MSETLHPANRPAAAVFALAPTAEQSAEHFAARVRFDTDASDVAAALAAGEELVVVDTRNDAAWAQGHVPGALHLPTREIAVRAAELIPAGTPVVVYCWSPGCNGAIRAGLEFSLAGYPVKEMLGGFEYWAREGYEFETGDGERHRFEVDPTVGVHEDGLVGAGARAGRPALVHAAAPGASGASCAC